MKERVEKLREWMDKERFAAFLVTSEDAHQSEYVAESDKRRAFVSGFTGSAGVAVLTHTHAYLWTDSRYLVMAEQQLDSSVWTVMNSRPTLPVKQLAETLPENARVAVDPWLLPMATARTLQESLAAHGHHLVALDSNPVDDLWTDRPPCPSATAFVHPLSVAGQSVPDKISAVRAELRKLGAQVFCASALDDVAWLLNVRGSDIPCNPLVISYALVTETVVAWFVEESKVTPEVREHLESANVIVQPYGSLQASLRALTTDNSIKTILVDPSKCSWALYNVLAELGIPSMRLLEHPSPIASLKCVKNAAELEGIREAHLRDAVALCSFLAWLESAVDSAEVDEFEAAAKLEDFRRQQPGFESISFQTTSAYGANAAIIHYKPKQGASAKIGREDMYLVDSGGQYRQGGTTDITRTVHFGQPNAYQRECFTRVLQGHVALSSCVFAAGTTGHRLDAIARAPLWRAGKDYQHGTGHGVGAFLGVHEGPNRISSMTRDGEPPLQPGMVSSIEPGYYEEGKLGIRIENVVVVRKAESVSQSTTKEFYSFEPVAFAPIQAKLIDVGLLSPEEVSWIDDYHARVWERISPLLAGAQLQWLLQATRPLSDYCETAEHKPEPTCLRQTDRRTRA